MQTAMETALEAALEAGYQCALFFSWERRQARGDAPFYIVRRGGGEEVLLSRLDAARWLSHRIAERADYAVLADVQRSPRWRALLDRMEDLAEHLAWWCV